MTRDDFMIICGDFGGVWEGGKKDARSLDRLENLPIYHIVCQREPRKLRPAQEIPHRGMERRKSPADSASCNHLMRGQVFDLQGYSFFTMGGARSHDIDDGILNPKALDFEEQYWALRRMGARFRVNHHSWWKQELPSKSEYEEARRNLERIHYKVDYVVTHCAPSSICRHTRRWWLCSRPLDGLSGGSQRKGQVPLLAVRTLPRQ